MLIHYKNKWLERVLIGVNALALAGVVGSFVGLFGFAEPLLPAGILYTFRLLRVEEQFDIIMELEGVKVSNRNVG
jgi:hypothetical protein